MRFCKRKRAVPGKDPQALVVLSLMLLGSLVFILGHSLQPATVSGEASLSLFSFLDPILGFLPFYSHALVRKLAHFAEYAILGAEAGGLTLAVQRGRIVLALLITAGALVALFDEYLQRFSLGRYPSLTDSLIDFSGYVLGLFLLLLLVSAKRSTKQKETV